jgi:hypothetical protein
MYRQYEKEEPTNEERNEHSIGLTYSDKEISDDVITKAVTDVPMGKGIKMNIGGRPMMCYPIMQGNTSMYDHSNCGDMMDFSSENYPEMYRQDNEMYDNRPNNYNPIRPLYPYFWYNFYPFYPQFPHYPNYPHYHQYPPRRPPYYREDWY